MSNKNYDRIISRFEKNDYKCADNFFEFAEKVYVTESPFFIQFSKPNSMHRHNGYILDGDHKTPPKGFRRIDEYLSPAEMDELVHHT